MLKLKIYGNFSCDFKFRHINIRYRDGIFPCRWNFSLWMEIFYVDGNLIYKWKI